MDKQTQPLPLMFHFSPLFTLARAWDHLHVNQVETWSVCNNWCYIVTKVLNNNNITFIRSYATQAHGHKPYLQIHNTVINWKKTHTRTCQNTHKKNTTCTDRDTKKKLNVDNSVENIFGSWIISLARLYRRIRNSCDI